MKTHKKPYIFLQQLIRRREREERDRMRGGGEAQFLTNHRDSEKHNYHSCMKINCHVDPVVPPRQLALVCLSHNFRPSGCGRAYYLVCLLSGGLTYKILQYFETQVVGFSCINLITIIMKLSGQPPLKTVTSVRRTITHSPAR